MARALQLAAKGLYSTRSNPRVGCVIARGERVLAEGYHQRPGEGHAEVRALQALPESESDLSTATAYVTLEPCSHYGKTGPCSEALIKAGIGRVVAAMVDPNPDVAGSGLARLQQAGVEVGSGLLESEARSLNPGFIQRMESGFPWVRLKMAASLDGRTALASGESQWITEAPARLDGHRWRARADAIVTGVETVLADNARLTPRADLPQGCSSASEPPLRVVLDSQLRTPADAALLGEAGRVLILHRDGADSPRLRALLDAGAECAAIESSEKGLDLPSVLRYLGAAGVNECHFECGARLAGSLLEEGLVDELLYYLAPVLIGSEAKPIAEFSLQALSEKKAFKVVEERRMGRDWRFLLQPQR
ncbi:riboflavin biosynthesis protein RibD [gamma proteobacterium HTCC5015]|nr:riboflavin biosynthesis protein RibD [gamma proteobacterium HTCC5015]